MKIAIVGAGAMGSLFGALLAESDQDVWLLDIWSEHVDAINQNGLRVQHEGETRTVRLNATTKVGDVGRSDLVIIFVKGTETAKAAETALDLAAPRGLVLTLQNGMGNADIIAQVTDPKYVVAGTTSHGATLLEPASILHAGAGPTTIGMWSREDPAKAVSVAQEFTEAGIQTEVVKDVRQVIWAKLLINVGINAITALTGIKNGQMLDLEVTRELCRMAVEEAVAVACAQGVAVRDDAVEHVLQVARATGSNRSSMGQDVDRKKTTEIASINGAVVREGRKAGLKTPVNETLTALVETLQAHY